MIEKKSGGPISLLEKGMWVDFVENNDNAQRMGYSHLVHKNHGDWSHTQRHSLSTIIASSCSDALMLFAVSPFELPNRIARSLIPPVHHKFRVIHVDLLGPCLALCILTTLLVFGQANKEHTVEAGNAVLLFFMVFPLLIFVPLKCCHAAITFMQLVTLLGYSLYGPILTLSVSLLIDHEKSNAVFFVCLAVFGGMSTLRVVLVVLASLRIPVARLVLCSIIALVQLLFVVYLHFAYLHPTFVYGHAGARYSAD